MKISNKHGLQKFFFKALGAVIIVYIIEQLLGAISHKDAVALSLQPFHNHYFSFNNYYLAAPGLGSAVTGDPSATVRFIIYFILGYLGYALVSVLLFLIWKRRAGKISAVLFYVMIAACFLKAFFFPPLISVIDTVKKETRITTYSWLFVPHTKHIAFGDVAHTGYDLYSDYDGYNKEYITYSGVFLTGKDGEKTKLGEMEAAKQKGTRLHQPSIELLPYNKQIGEDAVSSIEKLAR